MFTQFQELTQLFVDRFGLTEAEIEGVTPKTFLHQPIGIDGRSITLNPNDDETSKYFFPGALNESILIYAEPTTGDLKPVVLYIPQIESRWCINQRTGSIDVKKFHKYHVFNCSTSKLQEFLAGNNEGYHMHSNKKANQFYYKIVDSSVSKVIKEYTPSEGTGVALIFCKSCLKIYNKLAKKTVGPFDYDVFMDQKLGTLFRQPTFKYDFDDIPNLYSAQWKDIAKRFKEDHHYKCQQCGYQPANEANRKYIHVHHRDAQKYHNEFDNLQVLCIECHANQKDHGHIKSTPDYQKFLSTK